MKVGQIGGGKPSSSRGGCLEKTIQYTITRWINTSYSIITKLRIILVKRMRGRGFKKSHIENDEQNEVDAVQSDKNPE